jgi:hypothetical protein
MFLAEKVNRIGVPTGQVALDVRQFARPGRAAGQPGGQLHGFGQCFRAVPGV